ncbi:hypothetical protein AX16_002399 [Volvariella volvacea WC 439]|nr:hypothetical protein AX16_002399 [Volvariella volvacea WC 439]
MPALLSELPEDILLAICLHLRPTDLLSLKQTCRVLHAFGCTDYVWHRMPFHLPLNLPPHGDIMKLSAHELRDAVVRSLRLEHNWVKPSSIVRRLTRILHGDIIYHMQLMGSDWVVTLSRSSTRARISVWCLLDPTNAHRTTSFEVPLTTAKFSSSMSPGRGDNAIIALIASDSVGRDELLQVYSVPLAPSDDGSNALISPLPLYSFSRDKFNGSFVEVHACGHMVACAIAQLSLPNALVPAYRVWIFNLETKDECFFDPKLTFELEPPRFRLFQDRAAFVGIQGRDLLFHIHLLPASLVREDCGDANGISAGELLMQFQMNRIPINPLWQLSTDASLATPKDLNAVIFHAFSDQQGYGQKIRIPLARSGGPREQSHEQLTVPHVQQFPTTGNASAEIICLGSSGRRAVWLERNWETDEYRLVKATFDDAYPRGKVDALLPRHLALPFEPQTCRSIAFNEASGRVCLGLHTGELYVLDF